MNKQHKNYPVKVHGLFITLTRLLKHSMVTENCEISENSVEIIMLTAKAKLNKPKQINGAASLEFS